MYATPAVELVSRLYAASTAKAAQLLETRAPAGMYQFEADGQVRQDIWDGAAFIGCECDGAAGDPACDIYACWGRAPRG